MDTATFTDPITIAGGMIHENLGDNIAALSVVLDGDVSPGQSPGILNVVGDFAFATGDIFTAELGGTTPAVAGSVTISPNTTLCFSLFDGGSGPNYRCLRRKMLSSIITV